MLATSRIGTCRITVKNAKKCGHRKWYSHFEKATKSHHVAPTKDSDEMSSTSTPPSLKMPLSLPHTRDFWETVEAATITLKRMITSSSLRKNYFALASSEKKAVADIVDTPATNANTSKRYRDYRWLPMVLNRLAFIKDIQGNHLWKICNFQMADFYKVAPKALENFHDVLGELQNEFPRVSKEDFEKESKRIGEGLHDAMRKHRGQHQKPTYAEREVPHRKIGEFLGNVWYNRAQENPSSPERELSRMVSHFVFNTTYTLCRRVAFELSQRNAQYQKGSCRVKHISVRSARTFWVPRNGSGTEQSTAQAQSVEDLQKLLSYNDDSQGDENYDSPSGVMLQIKTLYCIQRTIEPRDGAISDNAYAPEKLTAPEDEVYHCEATFEGWLHGGPEGSLQWRIIELLDLNKDAS